MESITRLAQLVEQAEAQNVSVEVTLHNVPLTVAATWLAEGLIDVLEPGAPGNPTTGHIRSEAKYDEPRVSAVVFTDGPRTSR